MAAQKFNRNTLTFSQAQGIDPLPQPMALGDLSHRARNLLWSCMFGYIAKIDNLSGFLEYPWQTILTQFRVLIQNVPIDDVSPYMRDHADEIKHLILSQPYNRVFDLLQFILRHNDTPRNFYRDIYNILESCQAAYSIIEDGPTIVPIAIPEQRQSVEDAFKSLSSGNFGGARQHLRKAAEFINAGDAAGSIRESVHAVESVARRLDADAKTTLKPALDGLSAKGVSFHPAFREGILKFYGYTNDENGIRHSLLESSASVDIDNAVFMFGACAAFLAYLVNKARKTGLTV